MGGYSKIESAEPEHERPVDLQIQKPETKTEKAEETRSEEDEAAVSRARGERDGGGNGGGARLSRNRSVASGYGLQTTMKRALSMRRSSSVSERYCRIHDQNSATWPFPFQEEDGDGEEEEEVAEKKKKKKDKRGKFLKACKRFFGLS